MSRLRLPVVAVALFAVMSLMPTAAEAQPGAQLRIDLRLTHWLSSSRASSGGVTFGDWSTGLTGVELDFSYPSSRWGFGFNFFGGGQYNGGGSWTGLLSGSDQIYGGWVNYRLLPPTSPSQVNVWGGYGSYGWETTFSGGGFERFTSQGVMAGVSIYVPLAPNVDFGGTVIYHPSNSTSLESGGVTTSSSASAWDYRANLKYESGNWALLLGWRSATVNFGDVVACSGCVVTWSGVYGSIIWTR